MSRPLCFLCSSPIRGFRVARRQKMTRRPFDETSLGFRRLLRPNWPLGELPFSAHPCAVCARRFVGDRDMRRDAPAIDEPGDVFRRATDGMRGFDIEYHTVVGVDQIIGDNNLPRRKRPRFFRSRPPEEKMACFRPRSRSAWSAGKARRDRYSNKIPHPIRPERQARQAGAQPSSTR